MLPSCDCDVNNILRDVNAKKSKFLRDMICDDGKLLKTCIEDEYDGDKD